MTDFNAGIIEEFRANHGMVGGGFAGAPLVLLTTKGAKSGATRINPLMSLTTADGTLHVFASKGGAPTNPDWYYNLKANPEVTVEFGDDRFTAIATEVTGEERDKIYAELASKFAAFRDYEKQTDRKIPVIALMRKG
jgi:deazaflavin-dependent oxidoreductase (nitroreductase family)